MSIRSTASRWAAGMSVGAVAASVALISLPTAQGASAPAPLAPSDAPAAKCRVLNVDEDRVLESRDGWALSTAIELAAAGDRLRVKGVCKGQFQVDKDLQITGGNAQTAPMLTNDPGRNVLTVGNDDYDEISVKLGNLEVTGGVTNFTETSSVRMWKVRINDGGGLINYADVKAWSSSFNDNTETQTGWAIFNLGYMTLTRSEVRNNTGSGGGIFNENGGVTLNRTTVTGNEPENLGSDGSEFEVICSQIGDEAPTGC